MQFVVLADVNAIDFVGRVSMPILRDGSPTRTAWRDLEAAAVKHDTAVFDAEGRFISFRRGALGLSTWKDDIAAIVRSLGP